MPEAATLLPIDCRLPPRQSKILNSLWRDGFVTISGLLSKEDTVALQVECARLMDEAPAVPWSESATYAGRYRLPVFRGPEWSVLSNIAGLSSTVDLVLNRLLTDECLVPVLQAVLGSGYKVRQLGIRRSEGTDPGMRMHQDARGEFGVAVLLSEVPDAGGTTAFLPGSHRYPLTSVDAGMPFIHPRYLRRWAKPATGRPGDVCLFFNKTWHGRLPTVDAKPHDAIMLSLFGPGYELAQSDMPDSVTAELPAELRRLLDPQQGLRPLQNGRSLILGGDQKQPKLIDEAHRISSYKMHPAQLLRLLRPMFAGALPLKRWVKR